MKENYIGQIGIWGKRYKRLLSLMGRNRDELSKTLTDKQTEMLVKYDDAVNEIHSVAEVEAFSFSFRPGIRLMIETEGALTLVKHN